MTTRVCHSKTVVRPAGAAPSLTAGFTRDIPGRVMIPAYARPAHRRLRQKLAEILAWNEPPDRTGPSGGPQAGVLTSGISTMHVREADPDAKVLKLGMTYPVPVETIGRSPRPWSGSWSWRRGPVSLEAVRAAGSAWRMAGARPLRRVERPARAGDPHREWRPSGPVPPGKPPQLCNGCPHRSVFTALRELDCIWRRHRLLHAGGPAPFEAMDTCVCMGASLGVGLGLAMRCPRGGAPGGERHRGQHLHAQRIPGLVEMVYNPPPPGTS